MIAGLDSASEPTAAQAIAAKNAGVRMWSGYISTAPYDGGSHFYLWHPWSQGAFAAARLCGSTPIAYCSGWDNPTVLRALAASWAVRLCLDVESGIRGDGSWVQGFLDASGAGLYGNWGSHVNRRAAFHILAAYPGIGDPAGTWWGQTARPAGPCGWQWVGSHNEFGVTVDRGDYDDWFAGTFGALGGDMTDAELRTEHDIAQFFCWGIVDTSEQSYKDYVWARQHGMSLAAAIAGWKGNAAGVAWQAKLAAMSQPPPTTGSADHQAILDAIKADDSTETAILNAVGALTNKLDSAATAVAKIEQALIKTGTDLAAA
jgi:hypothetical protein